MKFSVFVNWQDGPFTREEFVAEVDYESLDEAKKLVQLDIVLKETD